MSAGGEHKGHEMAALAGDDIGHLEKTTPFAATESPIKENENIGKCGLIKTRPQSWVGL